MADGNPANYAKTGEDASAPTKTKGVYLGPDCTHTDARKRTLALEKAGVDLTAFMFRRVKSNADYTPEWNNIELGVTSDKNYLKRLPSLLKGLMILVWHGGKLRQADFIMARNFDMMFLGLLAKVFSFSGAKLVYDVPDIQRFFFGTNKRGRGFRFFERILLKRISLLVVTSHGFMRGYFEPVQNYTGKFYVWENKVLAGQLPDMSPIEEMNKKRDADGPWVISWHGTLRCPKSMRILSDVARRMGDDVKIYMRGKPTDYPDYFDHTFKGLDNVEFGGEYRLPDEFEDLYGHAHFSWCVDYHDPEGNSPLLLPNRLYQGGYLGVIPIAVRAHESGQYIERHDVGITLEAPLADRLVDRLNSMSRDDYKQLREKVLSVRDDLFLEDVQDMAKLISAINKA